jgi:hypothetical protein
LLAETLGFCRAKGVTMRCFARSRRALVLLINE